MRGGPTCVGDGITWSHGEPGGVQLVPAQGEKSCVGGDLV